MKAIAEIFQTYGPEYLKHYPNLPQAHKKVIDAITNCRSGQYGVSLYQCQSCRKTDLVNRSCGNRHCPNCQHHKTQKWLAKQLDRHLPGPHFMITFTVPENLRDFIRSHQRVSYEAMFRASSQALKLLAKDERFIGTNLPGFSAVLHTWGRQLHFHPHIHCLVPGGGLSKDRSGWLASRSDFYVPVRALCLIYHEKFKEQMKKAQLLPFIDPRTLVGVTCTGCNG